MTCKVFDYFSADIKPIKVSIFRRQHKYGQYLKFSVNLKSIFCVLWRKLIFWYGVSYPMTFWNLCFYRKIGTLPFIDEPVNLALELKNWYCVPKEIYTTPPEDELYIEGKVNDVNTTGKQTNQVLWQRKRPLRNSG